MYFVHHFGISPLIGVFDVCFLLYVHSALKTAHSGVRKTRPTVMHACMQQENNTRKILKYQQNILMLNIARSKNL